MKETAIVRKIQVNSYTRARFNSFNTGDILGWIILCHGAVICCRIFSSIPGFYLLNTNSILSHIPL